MLQFLAGKSFLVKDLFNMYLLQILKTPVIVPVQFNKNLLRKSNFRLFVHEDVAGS